MDYCATKYISIKNNIEGLESKTIKLRELSDCYGDENVANWIASWLVVLASKMDFVISQEQVGTASVLILEELYMVNISEFSLFFKRLLKGEYGIFYGKFNIQTILIACKKFRMERGVVISKMTTEEQIKLKL